MVTGIVDLPPVLGDQFDQVDNAVLPPAATSRHLDGEFAFGWVGLRLTAGSAGIPALQRHLTTVADGVDRMFRVPPGTIRLNIRRLDIVHHEVQQGIEPQAVALAVLGGLAALALLVLAGQAMAQLLDRSTPDLAGLRAVGASRGQAALASGLAGVVAVLSGTALAVAGAVAVSPLAPVGAVREFDPARGVQADPLVLAGVGVATLRQLGKRIGNKVTVGSGRDRRTLTIVGTVTLPSIGLTLTDHVSLGRGALLADSTLLAAQGLSPDLPLKQTVSSPVSIPAFPSAVAIDLAPGVSGKALVARISHANPGGTPGGTYRLPQNRIRGAAIVDAARMGSQPLALALAVAAGAVLSLALTLLASVRRRRRELALLKTLGLTRRQVMAAVAWQASVILVVAALIGVPLGAAAGHWAWAAFATSLGAVPVTVVPVPALLAGIVVLLVAGNLLAAGPGAVAARTPPAAVLRAE